jgi:hypothetical protein
MKAGIWEVMLVAVRVVADLVARCTDREGADVGTEADDEPRRRRRRRRRQTETSTPEA